LQQCPPQTGDNAEEFNRIVDLGVQDIRDGNFRLDEYTGDK